MKIALRHVRRIACIGLFSLLVSATASANFTCEGQVTYLGLSPEGFISVAVGGYGVWYICNQTTPFTPNSGGTFTPEGCRAWFASILAAQKSNHPIRFFFSSSVNTNNGPECAALGTWGYPNPAPYHMTVMN